MRQIPELFAKAICANLDYDVVIIYARKEGVDGGECISYAGSSYKMKRMADEMVGFLKTKIFGWSEPGPEAPTNSLGMPLLEEGPQGGDPDTGKRIIFDQLSKRRG